MCSAQEKGRIQIKFICIAGPRIGCEVNRYDECCIKIYRTDVSVTAHLRERTFVSAGIICHY
jgi:hypothetical protein